MRTEGLPKVFEKLETFEMQTTKNGTELVFGVEKETGDVYVF